MRYAKPKRVRKTKLKGKKYLIKWQELEDATIITKGGKQYKAKVYAVIDSPKEPERELIINPEQSEKDLLDTICHEAGHSFWWYSPEKKIKRFGKDLATLLWATGFRLKN